MFHQNINGFVSFGNPGGIQNGRPEGRPLKRVVEPRRIELRSILNCPQGATGLVSDQDSERIGSQTNVAAPSRFNLSRGHTDYVPWGIPLK